MFELDTRLFAAAELLGTGNTLADIGSDHAFLPIYMLKNQRIAHAIITDINDMPLKNSMDHVNQYRMQNYCEFRKGSGLEIIKDGDADLISICGMGGDLIATIIKNGIDTAKSAEKLVLQPMTNHALLRKNITEMGFRIIDEKMIRDRHLFYQIFSVQKGDETQYKNEIDFEFSPLLRYNKDETMREYIQFQLRVQRKIFAQLQENNQLSLMDESLKKIDRMKGLLNEYESETNC